MLGLGCILISNDRATSVTGRMLPGGPEVVVCNPWSRYVQPKHWPNKNHMKEEKVVEFSYGGINTYEVDANSGDIALGVGIISESEK